MNRNTDLDYYEEEVNETEEIIVSAMELAEIIDEKLENRPKCETLLKVWLTETNKLIDQYNTDFGHIYARVK